MVAVCFDHSNDKIIAIVDTLVIIAIVDTLGCAASVERPVLLASIRVVAGDARSGGPGTLNRGQA